MARSKRAPGRPQLDKANNDAYAKNIYGVGVNPNLAKLKSSQSTPRSIVNLYAKRTAVGIKTADKINRPGLNKGSGHGLIGLQDKKFTSVTDNRRGTYDVRQYSNDRKGEYWLGGGAENANTKRTREKNNKTIKINARVKTKGTRRGGK